MFLLHLVLGLSLVICSEPKVLRVLHRLHHPSLAPHPYSLRATIDTSGPYLHPAGSANDLQTFTQTIHGVEDTLYQVALEREGDSAQSDWVVSSVKACHLPSAAADSFILYLSSGQEIYNLNYFVSPVPHDGSCPEPVAQARTFLTPSNSTIQFYHPRMPPLPELRLPPPLTPQGQIVTPEPQQSFIQKYWMYIVGVLLVMMLAPAPTEEGAGPGQSGPAQN